MPYPSAASSASSLAVGGGAVALSTGESAAAVQLYRKPNGRSPLCARSSSPNRAANHGPTVTHSGRRRRSHAPKPGARPRSTYRASRSAAAASCTRRTAGATSRKSRSTSSHIASNPSSE